MREGAFLPEAGFTVVVVTLLATGCVGGFRAQTEYVWRLEASLEGTGASNATGTGLVVDGLRVENEGLRFAFQVRPGDIRVSIVNDSSAETKLLTEEARHFGEDGVARELLLATRKWDGSAPARVAPGKELVLHAWPRAWLRRGHEGQTATWRADSPIDGELLQGGSSKAEIKAAAQAELGRSFALVLPIRVGEEERRYRFVFVVEDVDVEFISWA